MSVRLRRAIAIAIVIAGLAPGLWWRDEQLPPVKTLDLRFRQVAVPPQSEYAPYLGPFALDAIWEMTSPHYRFGGYSTLLPPRNGQATAFSDRGLILSFTLPDRKARVASLAWVYDPPESEENLTDIEAATRDPDDGTVWLSVEGENALVRLRPGMKVDGVIRPRAMRDWGSNSGGEAMVRLADGRFIVIRERSWALTGANRRSGLLFAGDPLEDQKALAFTYVGTPGFSTTEIEQLPDGRVLILERKLLWPYPPRFSGRIVLADPAAIKAGKDWHGTVLARLESPLPIDNFEGMTVEERADGQWIVWIISDDNAIKAQRTLLWKLRVDPVDLLPPRKKARGTPARPEDRSK